MKILSVIPIARGITKDTLTYFSKEDVSTGSIISIPLRKKTAFGLVTEAREVTDVKSELKNLSFSIKKIGKVKAKTILLPWFIKSAEKIAEYYATSIGATLSLLIPKIILESINTLPEISTTNTNNFYETLLLQSDEEERYATYRSLIREEFAKNKSVFFCVPTTEDMVYAKPLLEKGIEKYTYSIHAGLSKKEFVGLWQKIMNEPHSVLVISTGSFLCLPRSDIGTIILEKESSRAYKTQTRPYADIRTIAEIIAKESKKRLVLGDTMLRIETLWEEKNPALGRVYAPLAPLKFRSLGTATSQIIDMHGPANMKKKEFSVISGELIALLKQAKENNEHVFLFVARKGLYPLTVCSDCGTIVTCKNCSAPVVLYSRTFICHHCGDRRDANELCTHCRGWRLLPLGIGTERVVQEISTLLPGTKISLMDKDHVKTHKQAVKIRDTFYGTPGGILIGTEMALTYLKEKIENTAVVSIDSYFSIPDFRIQEKIFHILLSLRHISEKQIIVQTRKEQVKIFEDALRGNLMDFYRDEIEERKLVGFPPFATYIKLTLEGEKNSVRKHMEETKEFLKPYNVRIYDAWIPGVKSKHIVHGLIALPRGEWVYADLLSKLRSLPPQYAIRVDPETLL